MHDANEPLVLKQALDAQINRDVIRNAIIKCLRRTEGLPEDLIGLLAADEAASATFAEALKKHAEQEEQQQ